MGTHSLRRVRLALPAFLSLVALGAFKAGAVELWRSPLHGLTFVQIEKTLIDPLLDAEQAVLLPPDKVFHPLPAEIDALLGDSRVDYESFTASYVPPGKLESLLALVREHQLIALVGIDRRIELPWHAFEAGDAARRVPAGFGAALRPTAVPNLLLVQFAYPLKEQWLSALRDCGATQLAYFQQRTVLVKVSTLGTLRSCAGAAPYISWIGAYLTSDRVSPELINEDSPEGYELQYREGTDLPEKRRNLPRSFQVDGEVDQPAEGAIRAAVLRARGDRADLRQLVESDPDLLSVAHRGSADWSDERQGQIVAGNHNGTAVTSPGYRSWLNSRGLLTASNQQEVCVVDSGYDDGGSPTPAVDHHPDLENPERLLHIQDFSFTTPADVTGHGTMVAGIIAGEGGAGFGTGQADPNGFLYGSGIAPGAKLAIAKINTLTHEPYHTQALSFCRNNPDGTDRALVANESWTENRPPDGTSPYYRPMNEYTTFARYFDDRVVNANVPRAGLEPMTFVFAAGNHAFDLGTNTIRRDSVSSPALAKNVIAVGATTSYRPAPIPPLDCRPTPDGNRPPNQDALHIARIASFSGRGKHFTPAGSDNLHTVRIKPDLVAPGIRVFSTIPYQFSAYGPGTSFVGCMRAYPDPTNSHYTYGSGTSFAAPVVTGVSALKMKWFRDRGVMNPSPSLLKAALLATAEDLGPTGLIGNDHRPSPNYGWGRVNLDRLTDSKHRFYVTDNQGLAVVTGQQRAWTRTVGNAGTDAYIVLVWSDPPSDVVASSQAPLKNNLGLTVEELGSNRFWRGNNFRENLVGDDNGYSYRFSVGELPLVDAINNVEAVFIPANTLTAGQQLIITVTGESVSTGSQKYAIYAYNVQNSQ